MKHLEAGLLILLVAAGATAAEPALRWQAPVEVQQDGSFVRLPLPPGAYGRSLAPDLADLRLVDASGQRVPFSWLPPREAETQRRETEQAATLYPLPRRAVPGAALGSPVEVLVQADRSIRVRQLGAPMAGKPDVQSPGWLFDLGERKTDQPAPQSLRLTWTGPAEFGAGFDIDTSATLREWRGAGSGQLMQLAAPGGAPLVQREVPLPADVSRFVRLVWRDTTLAPQLSGAAAVTTAQLAPENHDPLETLTLKPGAEPAGKTPPPPNALHFDLGGALPLRTVELQLAPGTRIAPVRLQSRRRADEPWFELGSWVFYRIERDGTASRSPPLRLQSTVGAPTTAPTTARYLRVLPDERAGALDPAATQLVVQAALAQLVFARQGQPPYRLLAGAADAANGALPVGSLVPQLDQERARLGLARVGAWTEVAAVAQQAATAERQAALRPWLLWGVLLAGVAGLAAMVWKLGRGGQTVKATTPPAT